MADLYPVYKDIDGVRTKMVAYKDIDGVRTKISSAEDDSIVGTWVFNSTLTYTTKFAVDMQFALTMSSGSPRECTSLRTMIDGNNTDYRLLTAFQSTGTSLGMYQWASNSWVATVGRSITIYTEPTVTDGWSTTIDDFITWLKANATKQ
jgi:hypothetical protein